MRMKEKGGLTHLFILGMRNSTPTESPVVAATGSVAVSRLHGEHFLPSG